MPELSFRAGQGYRIRLPVTLHDDVILINREDIPRLVRWARPMMKTLDQYKRPGAESAEPNVSLMVSPVPRTFSFHVTPDEKNAEALSIFVNPNDAIPFLNWCTSF